MGWLRGLLYSTDKVPKTRLYKQLRCKPLINTFLINNGDKSIQLCRGKLWTLNRTLKVLSQSVSQSASSVVQSCLTLCDPMNHSTPDLLVYRQLPGFTQTHVHRVSDAIQPSHPLLSPSPPAPNPSQHQGLFQWVNSPHEVAKVLEFQLQHQSFQWTPRTDLL